MKRKPYYYRSLYRYKTDALEDFYFKTEEDGRGTPPLLNVRVLVVIPQMIIITAS